MVVADFDTGVLALDDLRHCDDSTAANSQEKAEAAITQRCYGSYVHSKIPFAYDYVHNDSVHTGTTVAG